MSEMVMDSFRKQADRARANFVVIGDTGPGQVRVVEAEADTASHYAVVVSEAPSGPALGGERVITVLNPWQDAWTYTGADIDVSYVAEHLAAGRQHGGDLMALTMTIARALGGKVLGGW